MPGHVEFAVISAGEIDGVVYRQKGDWSDPASEVIIQLVDDKGDVVKEVKSQYDGFYLVEFIKPGIYTLRMIPISLIA